MSLGAIGLDAHGLGGSTPLPTLLFHAVLFDVVEIVMTLRTFGFAALSENIINAPVFLLADLFVKNSISLLGGSRLRSPLPLALFILLGVSAAGALTPIGSL